MQKPAADYIAAQSCATAPGMNMQPHAGATPKKNYSLPRATSPPHSSFAHAQVARLDRVMAGSSLLPGDVLRGVTCTNFVYPTQALFGAQAPRRTIVLYGADNQRWPKVCQSPAAPLCWTLCMWVHAAACMLLYKVFGLTEG